MTVILSVRVTRCKSVAWMTKKPTYCYSTKHGDCAIPRLVANIPTALQSCQSLSKFVCKNLRNKCSLLTFDFRIVYSHSEYFELSE